MADHARKSALIADLARARSALTIHTHAVRAELDFGARLKASFRRQALPWLGGAALLGLLLTLRPRRRKVVTPRPWRKQAPEEKMVKAGLLLTTLKIAFDLLRPALTKWILGRVTDYATGRAKQDTRR